MESNEEVCAECKGLRLKRTPCLACDLPSVLLYDLREKHGRTIALPCVCLSPEGE
jgi:hypothetical protein